MKDLFGATLDSQGKTVEACPECDREYCTFCLPPTKPKKAKTRIPAPVPNPTPFEMAKHHAALAPPPQERKDLPGSTK